MKFVYLFLIILYFGQTVNAQVEYHVAKTGNDKNPGTVDLPFLTIQTAANIAQPGDVITVHEGTYRERVTPVRGGDSDLYRITYQAAEGEKVIIKGSEIVKNWVKFAPGVWKMELPNSFFEEYNPYKDIIEGDWFNDLGRIHHTGEVYLNGKSLWESATLEGVLNPTPQEDKFDPDGSTYTWFCESDEENTYIYANFKDSDPNKELVEINVRESIFYPDTTGINYMTIRGFYMSQAATQWAAPTAEQIGLIGTFWSKGWIIENNIISDSKCSGITLGKDRRSGHNVKSKNPGKDGAILYNQVIEKALEYGWSKENIGSHIVRNNTIFNCGQTGICGSLGGVFSTIEGNNIYNIWTKRQFSGKEMAGIKIHASIDMIIRGNRIVNTARGLWLDWMAQGTRVSGNLFYNNTTDDLFVEVNHGPFLVDNNIMLSKVALRDWSQGGAFVHNLFVGNIEHRGQSRRTPYHLPHSTKIAGFKSIMGGDSRFHNNIFVGGIRENDKSFSKVEIPVQNNKNLSAGLKEYNNVELAIYTGGNIYLHGADNYKSEINFLKIKLDPDVEIFEQGENIYLSMKLGKFGGRIKNKLISTQMLGKALITNQRFENRDGTLLSIDHDYFGNKRGEDPTAGPFENIGEDEIKLKVWHDKTKPLESKYW